MVVGVLTAPTRVLSKAREPIVQAWSLANEPSWDAAANGNGALQEAFSSSLGRRGDGNFGAIIRKRLTRRGRILRLDGLGSTHWDSP
eukprot:6619923-Pyramimonas_sp.AAC.1